jgi:hypothetical protein
MEIGFKDSMVFCNSQIRKIAREKLKEKRNAD